MMKCRVRAAAGFRLAVFLLPIFFLADGAGVEKWWSVHFTRPGSIDHAGDENLKNLFIRQVDRSTISICGAFYELSVGEIGDALIRAKRRGVNVRLVLEKDNCGNETIDRILGEGIPVAVDDSRGLMHNKFAVFDESRVWTGSCNLTQRGIEKNDNNIILINSRELASIYLEEFTEMFKYGIFGNRKDPGIFSGIRSRYYVNVQGTPVNVYFSPENDVERIIISRIKKAKKTIHFMLFSFTSDLIGDEMIAQQRNGVHVYGVFERKGAKTPYSEFTKMKMFGLRVKLDGNIANMHHKVLVIDSRVVITGSYNFSRNAARKNDENLLIVENADIARLYINEFRRVYDQGRW